MCLATLSASGQDVSAETCRPADREDGHMTNTLRLGRSREGAPEGDPITEVTVRLFARPWAGDTSWRPQGGPFSGAAIDWSYPEYLHHRALTRVTVVRHAISVLLDDLEGSTTGRDSGSRPRRGLGD